MKNDDIKKSFRNYITFAHNYIVWFGWFYGISILVGYFTPNPVYVNHLLAISFLNEN